MILYESPHYISNQLIFILVFDIITNMVIQIDLGKLKKSLRRSSLALLMVWFLVILFLAMDGINQNLYGLDWDILLRGVYDNRYIIYLPVWIFLYCKIIDGYKSGIGRFFSRYSLIIFILLINLYHLIQVLPYEDSPIYIVRLIMSFLVIVSIMPFIQRILKLKKEDILLKVEEEVFSSKKEIFLIISLITIAFITRFLFLDGLFPTTDEYLHLREAQKIVSPIGILFHNGEYERAFFITWILKELFLLFEMSVSIARLPGVIISCLTTILFYFVLRKENKTLAILSSLLFAFSPWSSMLSRTIREYTYFLPFFLVLGVYVYKRAKRVLDKKYKPFSIIIDLSLFATILYYCFFIDPLSTAKFSLIIYLAGFVYWLLNYVKKRDLLEKMRNHSSWKRIFMIMIVTYILLVLANQFFGLSLTISQIDIIPSFNPSWVGYIFFNEEYGSLIMGGVFLVVALLSSVMNIKKGGKWSFLTYATIIFSIIIYFFTFHFGRYYRPRYISIILPFVIYLEACGVLILKNFLYKELHIQKGKILLLLLLFTNWIYFFSSFLSSGSGYVKISNEFHEGLELVYEEIKDRDEGYIIVTTLPDAADWYWDEDIKEIFKFAYSDDNREFVLDNLVASYEKGFFIIDSRRNLSGGHVFKNNKDYTTKSGYKLKFITTIDIYSVYEWNRSLLSM